MKIWGFDGYVCYLDCGNDFSGVCIYGNLYFKYGHFIVCSLYLNKVVFEKHIKSMEIFKTSEV